jgi:HSP20 family protein
MEINSIQGLLPDPNGGAMTIVHRSHRHLSEWPTLGWPDLWRPLIGPDEQEWLRMEEFHDGDTLVLRAELPAIDPDKDVDITLQGARLHIRAQREEKSEHKEKEGYRSEFRYGSFERTIAVPTGTSADDVKASYSDGILEIRVPCPAEAETSTKVAVAKP